MRAYIYRARLTGAIQLPKGEENEDSKTHDYPEALQDLGQGKAANVGRIRGKPVAATTSVPSPLPPHRPSNAGTGKAGKNGGEQQGHRPSRRPRAAAATEKIAVPPGVPG